MVRWGSPKDLNSLSLCLWQTPTVFLSSRALPSKREMPLAGVHLTPGPATLCCVTEGQTLIPVDALTK